MIGCPDCGDTSVMRMEIEERAPSYIEAIAECANGHEYYRRYDAVEATPL